MSKPNYRYTCFRKNKIVKCLNIVYAKSNYFLSLHKCDSNCKMKPWWRKFENLPKNEHVASRDQNVRYSFPSGLRSGRPLVLCLAVISPVSCELWVQRVHRRNQRESPTQPLNQFPDNNSPWIEHADRSPSKMCAVNVLWQLTHCAGYTASSTALEQPRTIPVCKPQWSMLCSLTNKTRPHDSLHWVVC